MAVFFFLPFYSEVESLMDVVEASEKLQMGVFFLVLFYDAERVVYVDFEIAWYIWYIWYTWYIYIYMNKRTNRFGII